MTLNQLKYLVALDTHRSFRKAAAACHVAQPSLSMQIRKLEDELGGALFDRSKKEISPTSLGAQVVEQARLVLAEAGRIPQLVRAEVETLTGKIRLGMLPTVAPYVLPALLARLRRKHPQVVIHFEEGKTAYLLDRLRQGHLDAALVSTPISSRGLSERMLYEEPLVGFLSKGHPLREKETLTADALTPADLWLPGPEHALHAQTLALLKWRADAHPTGFLCDGLETLKRLVEQYQGMAVLPALAVHGSQAGYVRPFSSHPTRTIRLVSARTYLNTPMLDLLTQAVRATVSTRRGRSVPVHIFS